MEHERAAILTRSRSRPCASSCSIRICPIALSWPGSSKLRSSPDDWKICAFRHPLYSNARAHGSALDLRVRLEPLFVQYGVDVVFSGHDHVYERFRPQKDIVYFGAGAGGQLRQGDVRPGAATAASFDRDRSFVIAEVSGDELFFQTVARTGEIVDGGVIRRRPKT
jgi:hypothetical protein